MKWLHQEEQIMTIKKIKRVGRKEVDKMNKKLVTGIILGIIVVILGVIVYAIYNNNQNGDKIGNNELEINNTKKEVSTEENIKKENKKVLVVYYSAQSHTKLVAEKIANNLNADIFEIIPEQKYISEDLDWTDDNSRVSKEHNDENLRNVKLTRTQVDNFENYDTILIGYPIWWGIAAWPVDSFVKANDFSGKTVIPFCTSASSGLGQSGKLLEKEANSGKWLEGHRFSSNPSDSDIKNWTDSLK